ncbi:MAG: GNAT family N-acetyltransferase [Ruminococcaceae bacterium]|nr:GNAT family N-acetyltransferase [Oscillospiraceae bacterium]
MLKFQKARTEDFKNILECVRGFCEYSCEFSLVNLMLWQEAFCFEFCIEDGILYTKNCVDGRISFGLPFSRDMKKAIDKIKAYCTENNLPICFFAGEGERLNLFKEQINEDFDYNLLRNSFEYIYSSEDLICLSGKKFHSKRNHISRFSKQYIWSYESLSVENVPNVKEMLSVWYEQNVSKENDFMSAERTGLTKILDNFSDYDIKGGVLRVDGKVIAFTLGCQINKDTFDVNIEKALGDYDGAYAMINNQFAKNELSGYKYINREEDMGIEGLRKAKLSYRPEILLKKFLITEKMQNKSIKEQCKDLYIDAFKDDVQFTNFLFDTCFDEDCFYIEKNGEVISMLFAFDVYINDVLGKYVYGVATKEKYRSMGYMRILFDDFSEKIKDKYKFLCLRPMNDGLFEFYNNKLGFENKFTKKFIEPLKNEKVKEAIKINCEKQLMSVRKALQQENFVQMGEKFIELLFFYCDAFTDSIVAPTYLVIKERDSGKIKEIIGDISAVPNIFTENTATTNGDKFYYAVYKSLGYNFCGDGYLGLAMD